MDSILLRELPPVDDNDAVRALFPFCFSRDRLRIPDLVYFYHQLCLILSYNYFTVMLYKLK